MKKKNSVQESVVKMMEKLFKFCFGEKLGTRL